MAFKTGNKYTFKPKYTEEDMVKISEAVKTMNFMDMMNMIEEMHPGLDERTKYSWVEKAAMRNR